MTEYQFDKLNSPDAEGSVEKRTCDVIIIEPSQGTRRLDPKKSQPHSLDRDDAYNRPAMEWLLHALQGQEIFNISYVGGYHIEKVLERYSDLNIIYQKDRLGQGDVASILLASHSAVDLIIARADVLYLPNFFDAFSGERGVTFGEVKSSTGKSVTVAIHVGAASYEEFIKAALALVESNPLSGFGDLQATMPDDIYKRLDLDGFAAVITDKTKVSQTIFKGKAQTLDHIAPLAKEAQVLARMRFTVLQWQENPDGVLASIGEAINTEGAMIVRSSTISEDQHGFSAAGAFDSVLDVDSSNRRSIIDAIEQVILSYSKNGREVSNEDEVLIQPQVRGLISSGVLLTRDPRSGAPYLIINADETTGRSDLVTSGGEGQLKMYCALSGSDMSHLPKTVQQAFRLGNELVSLSHIDALDIEFGIDQDFACYLFQVRPLAVKQNLPIAEDDFLDMLNGARDFVRSLMRSRKGIYGTTTVLGSMPDWNPVEMLGETPNPLALSIYQTLIGNLSWSEARGRIGYREITPEALIVSVAGRPYVDVRASLNSFLPAGLSDAVAEKWIEANLQRLRQFPHLHDKIEFEIAATCLAPDWNQHARRMYEAGLSEVQVEEFKSCLRELTQNIVDGNIEPIGDLQASLTRLEERRCGHMDAHIESVSDIACRIRVLLEDCRQHGIVPFSILARYAFIAMTFLRGLRDCNIISDVEFEQFLRTVPTVASRFSEDMHSYANGGKSLQELTKLYGHLRPHSYDISSANYASNPERFFNIEGITKHSNKPNFENGEDVAEVLSHKAQSIEEYFRGLGLDISFEKFLHFVKSAIAAREMAKFQFMRNLNGVLEDIALLGQKIGFERDKLAFIPVEEFMRLGTDGFNHAQSAYFRRMVEFIEKRWLLTCAIRLPELICTPSDVGAFGVIREQPNFVTRKCVQARTVWLDDEAPPYDLDGAIVAIRSADPGYDWIFSYSLAGLLTQYGGVGSHMSIRAAEFGLPAAIGCGRALFDKLRGAAEIEIDGQRETVKKL